MVFEVVLLLGSFGLFFCVVVMCLCLRAVKSCYFFVGFFGITDFFNKFFKGAYVGFLQVKDR